MPTPLRVLITEDRPADAELMAHELIRSGFEPEWKRVETEEEYMAELETSPDVILADHTLPRFNATRALDLLKNAGLDIPLIVVTGSISEEVAVERMKQGAADYILKDRMVRLGPAVKRALQEKGLRDEKRQADATLQARYRELQNLHDLSQKILNTLDLKTVLNEILDQAMAIDSFDIGTILLVDASGKKVEAVAVRGYEDPANVRRQPREEGSGIGRHRALAYEQTYIVDNVPEAEGLRTLKKEGVQSGVLTPVRAGEKTLGFIQVGSRTRRKFDPDKIRLLEAVGNQMGVAIQKARLYEETQRNLERIRALHEIDKAISSTLDLRRVLNVLLEKLDAFLPYAAAAAWLFNREVGHLEPVACRNINEEEWKTEMWKARTGLTSLALQAKAPVVVRNIQTDPLTLFPDFYKKHGLVSFVGVPMFAKGEVLGVLGFYTQEQHEFSVQEVEFLNTLGGQAAIAIHNAQLYEESKKQAMELERSNRVKDEFLSVMSHELRTPLSVVTGYASMLQDGALGEVNPQQEKACGKIIRRTEDLLSMVNSILFTTSLEAKSVKAEKHPVNLTDLLSEVRAAYETSLEKELDLVWDYPSEPQLVSTDETKLKHILHNLINNAIKFTEKGSITVSVRLTAERWVELKVTDTGIGIPKEMLSAVFEKFRQLDSSETRLYGGVGLGLYIVKQFAGMLGGTVTVESEPGKGSTFTLKLPCGTEE